MTRPARRRLLAASGAALAGPALALVVAGPVLAHGPVPDAPPDLATLVLGWSFDPVLFLPLLASVWLWRHLVVSVNRAHPDNPVPRRRSAAFYGGLFAIAVALQSGIERYDTALFSIHMVQHLLLTMVAAPLLALAGPVTLLLRAASARDRKRVILPILHSWPVRVLTHPVVDSLLFAGVMWGAHFSPLFDQALEDRLLHDLEHLLFLGAGLLFWWPALGVDPAPHRLAPAGRVLYTFLQMPQNTFLSVAILFAPQPLYAHYATLSTSWLPDPLRDQQLAGGIMWLGGDLMFLVTILGLVWDWTRKDERQAAASERRVDLARAAIRAREVELATRRAEAAGRAVTQPASEDGGRPATPEISRK